MEMKPRLARDQLVTTCTIFVSNCYNLSFIARLVASYSCCVPALNCCLEIQWIAIEHAAVCFLQIAPAVVVNIR